MTDYVKKGTCGSCKYYEYEGAYSKGYCNYYRCYYYPDDSCRYWTDNGTFSSAHTGCFITSACCGYKGLPDDCDELKILRRFRDTYLQDKAYGKELIQLYYKDAPEIVKKINSSDQKNKIYENIYVEILKIVNLIKLEKFEDAVVLYALMVYKLSQENYYTK